MTPVSSEAVAVTVIGPYTESPSFGEVIAVVGAVVSGAVAVTCTSAELPVLPAASWATVRSVCGPAVAVQLKLYGAEVSVATVLPSTCRSTAVTPTLSEAVAVTGTLPVLTPAPSAGELIEVVGGTMSGPDCGPRRCSARRSGPRVSGAS